MDPKGIALFSLVALFWGGTNPLIERSVNETKDYKADDYSPNSVLSVIKSKIFIIAFGINQIGSVLYASLLSSYGEEYSSIVANSLTTGVTFLSELMWKGKKAERRKIFGLALVLLGVYLVLT